MRGGALGAYSRLLRACHLDTLLPITEREVERERSRERHTHTHTHTHTQTHRQTDIFMAIDCCVVQISVSNPYATDEEEVANGSVGPAALSVACSRLVHALTGTAMERESVCV